MCRKELVVALNLWLRNADKKSRFDFLIYLESTIGITLSYIEQERGYLFNTDNLNLDQLRDLNQKFNHG